MDSSQKLIELEARIKELEEKHSALVRYVANKLNWTPDFPHSAKAINSTNVIKLK